MRKAQTADEEYAKLNIDFEKEKTRIITKIDTLTTRLEVEKNALLETRRSRVASVFTSGSRLKMLVTAPGTFFSKGLHGQLGKKTGKIEYLKALRTNLADQGFSSKPIDLKNICIVEDQNQYQFAVDGATSRVASIIGDVEHLLMTAATINASYQAAKPQPSQM